MNIFWMYVDGHFLLHVRSSKNFNQVIQQQQESNAVFSVLAHFENELSFDEFKVLTCE